MTTELGYNVAINFFGNYSRELDKVQRGTHSLDESLRKASVSGSGIIKYGSAWDRVEMGFGRVTGTVTGLFNRLMSVQNLLLGGGIAYGIANIGNKLYQTGLTMENNFASIKTALDSDVKTIEGLMWARKKAAETPFELPDVNQALLQMAKEGLTKTNDMREKVFTAIGDMAGAEGFDFGTGMYMFTKAGEGNWMQLSMRTGLRMSNMINLALQSNRTEEEKKKMIEYANVVKKAAKGTTEYKMALAEYLAIMYKGGMENRVKTVGGALSNVSDLMSIFTMEIVGYTQQADSFFHSIMLTVKDKFLGAFSKVIEVQKDINGNVTQQITLQDKLFESGRRIGGILKIMWSSVDSAVGGLTERLEVLILKMNAWLSDFQGNVAPMIIAFTIIKMRVKDFFNGFKEGFSSGFGFFWNILKGLAKTIIAIIGFIKRLTGGTEEADSKAKRLGKTVGLLIGSLVGLRILLPITNKMFMFAKSVKFATTALLNFINTNKMVEKVSTYAQIGTTYVAEGFSMLGTKLGLATRSLGKLRVAFLGLNTVLVSTPIGWIILIVAALVAGIILLVKHWDKVREHVSKVPDWIIMITTVMMPLIGAVMLLAKYWEQISTIVKNAFKTIKNYARGVWDWLVVKARNTRDSFVDTWNKTKEMLKPVKDFFTDMFKTAKKQMRDMWDALTERFPFIERILKAIGDMFRKYILEPIQKIKAYITDSFSKVFGGLFEKDALKTSFDDLAKQSQTWVNASGNFADRQARNKYLSDIKEGTVKGNTIGGTSVFDLLMANKDTYGQGTSNDRIVEALEKLNEKERGMVIDQITIKVDGKTFNADEFVKTLESLANKKGK